MLMRLSLSTLVALAGCRSAVPLGKDSGGATGDTSTSSDSASPDSSVSTATDTDDSSPRESGVDSGGDSGEQIWDPDGDCGAWLPIDQVGSIWVYSVEDSDDSSSPWRTEQQAIGGDGGAWAVRVADVDEAWTASRGDEWWICDAGNVYFWGSRRWSDVTTCGDATSDGEWAAYEPPLLMVPAGVIEGDAWDSASTLTTYASFLEEDCTARDQATGVLDVEWFDRVSDVGQETWNAVEVPSLTIETSSDGVAFTQATTYGAEVGVLRSDASTSSSHHSKRLTSFDRP